MICQLRGTIMETSFDKDLLRVVVDVHGVGYEVWMARANEGRLREGQGASLLISESVTAFDGATTLYDTLSALLNLGYDEGEARELLARAKLSAGAGARVESLVKEALKLAGARHGG